MDRRKTTIAAIVAASAVAAGSAVALGVPTQGAATEVDAQAVPEIVGTQVELFGTSVLLPDEYAAFSMEDGAMQSVGDADRLNQATLDAVEQQLAAAPAGSVVFVDLDSKREDGLTTALATVTPTNGLTLGSTNEQLQQWLTGLFPEAEGTAASLPMPNIPNASFTYTESVEDTTWQITEYVAQFADAAVSVRLSTVDATGETQAEFDQIVASMTR
jgi:hypothetical protein